MNQRYRARQYPFIIDKREVLWPKYSRDECEACHNIANYQLKYEPNAVATELSVIVLCKDHERAARYGEWTKVFKDMNAKLDKQLESYNK